MNVRLDHLGTLSREDKIFAENTVGKITAAENKQITSFTFFLNEGRTEMARKIAASLGFENYMLWGGYENAERVMLGAFAPYEQPDEQAFPLCAVSFRYRERDKLSHRDFLGALIGLGVARDTIGDIIIGNGEAAAFMTNTAASLALGVEKIGRVGVAVSEGIPSALKMEREYKDIDVTISSLRLDCVISQAVKCSREEAQRLIRSGMVMIKGQRVTERDKRLEQADTFSVRGHGKFILDNVGQAARSGRIHIRLKKFI